MYFPSITVTLLAVVATTVARDDRTRGRRAKGTGGGSSGKVSGCTINKMIGTYAVSSIEESLIAVGQLVVLSDSDALTDNCSDLFCLSFTFVSENILNFGARFFPPPSSLVAGSVASTTLGGGGTI
eukprot:8414496-Ditylum_brightwellii.AAC.1